MVDYNITTTLWTEMFQQTTILGVDWLFSAGIILIALAVITRNFNSWKVLAFPVSIAIHSVVTPVNMIVLMVTAVLFVIDSLSLEAIGRIAEIAKTRYKEYTTTHDEVEKWKEKEIKKRGENPLANSNIPKIGFETGTFNINLDKEQKARYKNELKQEKQKRRKKE